MANCGIYDLDFQGPSFTWCNNQSGMSRVWERLDRCLVNGMGINQFTNLKLKHLPTISSDRCHILLYVEEEKKRGKHGFKFMGMWTTHKDFLGKVNEAWSKRKHINPLVNFALKLKETGQILKSWNWSTFGDINKNINDTLSNISALEGSLQQNWNQTSNSDLKEMRQHLTELLRIQNEMLEEKAKVKWLHEGDRNTGLFHASIKDRRAQNNIKLTLEDGSITEDAGIIGNKASSYFKDLFGMFPDSEDIGLNNLIDVVILEEENDKITKNPSMDELKDTVFSMNSDSSLGLDGFTGKFYKTCWDIIKADLHEAVCGFFEGLHLPKIISSTRIVLIPKVHKASTLDQVRSISLCNFIHKIISKILNARITSVLHICVSPEQFGFIEGRNIHDCIGMTHDMVRDINSKCYGAILC
ncbi:hypothetical protein QQ045_003710 [Rhodiola kirilowii]